MTEFLCEGINSLNICMKIDGVRINTDGIILPLAYRGWTKEKAVYSQKEDKLYVQISFKNLRRVIVL